MKSKGDVAMYKDTLKNRVRFATTLSKESHEKLKRYAAKTMIPVSRLMDLAIEKLVEPDKND